MNAVHIPQDDSGPIVMVDDSEDDIVIAQRCHRRAGLRNPFVALPGGQPLLDHLAQVEAGRAPMPALVLLDINMPDISGFEVLHKIRSNDTFRQVPVVMMLTNSDDPEDIRRAKEGGASGLQVKPTRVKDYVAFFESLAA